MESELLREAARGMRTAHGPEHPRHEMWTALADWLDGSADFHDAVTQAGGRGLTADHPGAVRVARAYLGAVSHDPR